MSRVDLISVVFELTEQNCVPANELEKPKSC